MGNGDNAGGGHGLGTLAWIGAIVVVIALVIVFIQLPITHPAVLPPDGNGDGAGANGGFTIVESTGAGRRVLLEDEDAKAVEAPFALTEAGGEVAAGASGGKCFYLGPEKVNESPEMAQLKKGHPQAKHPGYVSYEFTVPATDEYALWLRAWWADDCGDSVSISLNGSPPRTLGGGRYRAWGWVLFRTGSGQAARIRLQEGETHTLTVINREDDLYIDQILLLGTDRPWPDPSGIETKD